MWPECINELSPYEYAYREETPKFLKQTYERTENGELCNPVQNVSLLGICKTSLFKDCPNMPEHHIENAADEGDEEDEYYDDIGRYFWMDFDATTKTGTTLPLRMVFNEGDADCNDGFWGAVWKRDSGVLVANIASTGDCQATITANAGAEVELFEEENLTVLDNLEPEDDDKPLTCASLVYSNGFVLEKIIGLAIMICSIHTSSQFYDVHGYA